MNAMAKLAEKENRAAQRIWRKGSVDSLPDPIVDYIHKAAKDHRIMAEIVDFVVEHTGISREDIMGVRRHGPIARARHVCMWRSIHQGISSLDVADYFNRDHSTVLYAKHKLDKEFSQ